MKSHAIALNRSSSRSVTPARRRRGTTLIDVAVGSMLLAVLLVPSVHLIGKSRASNHRLATRDAILYEADRLLESTKTTLGEPTAFNTVLATPSDITQLVPLGDVPNLASRIRVAADPSLPSVELLTILVDVWQDSNGNGSMDSDEPSESLRTQWASP
jgi:hypothetical protein